MNSDFKELLLAVVGGYAVMAYTEPCYTKDLDVWVRAEAATPTAYSVAWLTSAHRLTMLPSTFRHTALDKQRLSTRT